MKPVSVANQVKSEQTLVYRAHEGGLAFIWVYCHGKLRYMANLRCISQKPAQQDYWILNLFKYPGNLYVFFLHGCDSFFLPFISLWGLFYSICFVFY